MTASQVMLGMAYIGAAAGAEPDTQRQAQAMVQVLTGAVDADLRHALVFMRFGSSNATEEQLRSEEVSRDLEQLKANVRRIVQAIFDGAAEEERNRQATELERVQAELRASNRPDPMGTVAEIASKFSISKSEVRRLKAAGQLHTLVKP